VIPHDCGHGSAKPQQFHQQLKIVPAPRTSLIARRTQRHSTEPDLSVLCLVVEHQQKVLGALGRTIVLFVEM
jgi:hypothetical protein